MSTKDSDNEHATLKLGSPALVQLAEAAIARERFADAFEIYSSLASANRCSSTFVARAYYARGLMLLAQNARTEARMELEHALFLDPNLDAARNALDLISTSRMKRLFGGNGPSAPNLATDEVPVRSLEDSVIRTVLVCARDPVLRGLARRGLEHVRCGVLECSIDEIADLESSIPFELVVVITASHSTMASVRAAVPSRIRVIRVNHAHHVRTAVERAFSEIDK